MTKINLKPLSVNEAWKGRRIKTTKYKNYEKALLLMLPKTYKMPEPPYHIEYTFGFSSVLSDVDNPVKLVQDILQKKYKFNDKDVYSFCANKEKVAKGEEYLSFEITSTK
jgi:Holliday junction resolvase RusA-like endonuclease